MVKFKVKDKDSAVKILMFIVKNMSTYGVNGKFKSRGPITLEFSESVKIYSSEYQKGKYTAAEKNAKKASLYFFISTGGALCYANRSNFRRGRYSTYLPLDKCVCITALKPEEEAVDYERLAEKFACKILPGMWDNLKTQLFSEEGAEFVRNHQTNIVDIRKIFSKTEVSQIQEAIKDKKSYSCRIYGKKRDRSVSVEPDDSGKFVRAWYSSEYSGCGNGCYYLLLNDHEATFGEYD